MPPRQPGLRGGFRRHASGLFRLQARGFLGGLPGFLFRGLLRLFLAPAGFLGGREDGNLLLFAPLSLPAGRLALLLLQRTLPRRGLGRG